MTTELVINKQPLSKLSYNTDNFKRLKEAYEAAMDLTVQLNSRILLLTPVPPVANKAAPKKTKS
tara:strand:- start:390 stop:581 length:192 start_codon:yes stop_codon:yes gene_type:complete